MSLTIGADPEFFLTKNNTFASAYGVIPGTKSQPYKVEKGAIQVDGMAVEFNLDPTSDERVFLINIDSVLLTLRDMIPKDYDFNLVPSIEFDEEFLKSQPREAISLGCDPDFNAYTEAMNEPPDQTKLMRTAAGHIHLGWTQQDDVYATDHFNKCVALTKQLDCSLGALGVIEDGDTRRKEMYGKAGAFRPKPYGLEYRVLSNYWLSRRETAANIFRTAKQSFYDFENGIDYHGYCMSMGYNPQEVINENHKDGAYMLLEHVDGARRKWVKENRENKKRRAEG